MDTKFKEHLAKRDRNKIYQSFKKRSEWLKKKVEKQSKNDRK